MKSLFGFIGRVSDVFSRRMPVRVNARRNGAVGFRVQHLHFPVHLQHRRAVRAAHVKAHERRIIFTESVTVDAGTGNQGVFNNGFLVKVRQISLINAHLAVNFIARRNHSVHQSIINGIRADMYRKRFILLPHAIRFQTNQHLDVRTFIAFKQVMPFFLRKLNDFITLYVQGAVHLSRYHNVNHVVLHRFYRKI